MVVVKERALASTMSSVEREAHGNARERKDDNESGAEDRDVGGVLTVARLGPRAELRRLDGDLSTREVSDLDLAVDLRFDQWQN